ncbi:response regulator [Candidatus Saccharibacteria bacterium]|nr:response regulator [Candidatus Saccharibacteria bacterium]
MSKIMVVEDDASLREIYSIRITAEGYEVVSAGDGEEALAVAVREKPDLILSDIMMPKISGFDMLDILRSTPETADIKVVVMTALSAEDQRQRGERLGADRYLVKSQVGIEDVVNTIHEVLGDREAPAAAPSPENTPPPTPEVAPVPAPEVAPTPAPVAGPIPTPEAVPEPAAETPTPEPTLTEPVTEAPAPEPAAEATPLEPAPETTITEPVPETPAPEPQANNGQPAA